MNSALAKFQWSLIFWECWFWMDFDFEPCDRCRVLRKKEKVGDDGLRQLMVMELEKISAAWMVKV